MDWVSGRAMFFGTRAEGTSSCGSLVLISRGYTQDCGVGVNATGKTMSTQVCGQPALTEMLGDVNHWRMDKHCVFSETHAHSAHVMLVIGKSHSLHHSTALFLLSFSPTLFCTCLPCTLTSAHSFMGHTLPLCFQ